MANQLNAFEGFWTNHMNGKIMGATYTTSASNRGFIIAFLALFVRTAGVRFWNILRFILFRLRSTAEAQDGLYHQHQTILRNSANEADALWNLWQVSVAWRGKRNSPFARSAGLAIFAIINLAGFVAAGLFVSRVTDTRSEVLMSGNAGLCGDWLLEQIEEDVVGTPGGNARVPVSIGDSRSNEVQRQRRSSSLATGLSTQCYNASTPLPCTVYGRSLIPWSVRTSERCPFDNAICAANATAILDSGWIDSLTHLGINSLPEHKLLVKINSTCTDLKVEEFSEYSVGPGDSQSASYDSSTWFWNKLHLGNSTVPPYGVTDSSTYMIAVKGGGDTEGVPMYGSNYWTFPQFQVDAEWAYLDSRKEVLNAGTFLPIDQLRVPDSKLELIILAFRNRGIEPFKVSGCVTRKYFCSREADDSSCRQLPWLQNGTRDSYVQSMSSSMTPQQAAIFQRLIHPLISTDLATVTQHTASRLLMGTSYYENGTLPQDSPPDLYLLDLQNIFSAAMIKYQIMVNEFIQGYERPAYRRLPSRPEQEWMCGAQIVPSQKYASFSVLGVSVIVITGALIIVISWCIDDLVHSLQRNTDLSLFRKRHWKLSYLLQLHRLAFESSGHGIWTGTGMVPQTTSLEEFGVPQALMKVEAHSKTSSERSNSGYGQSFMTQKRHGSDDDLRYYGRRDGYGRARTASMDRYQGTY